MTDVPRANTTARTIEPLLRGTTSSGTSESQHTLTGARDAAGALFGAVLGLAPHVLHHVAFFAGAALVTGAGGNVLFFLVGLTFSIPMLRRLYRRFGTWAAPAIAVAVFAMMFSFSAFVLGPAITGGADSGGGPSSPSQTPADNHAAHHGG
jgi:hypothetical protein